MSAAFPRIYRSFDEFQREELRKLDSLRTTVDDMMEERFSGELDFDDSGKRSGHARNRWQ